MQNTILFNELLDNRLDFLRTAALRIFVVCIIVLVPFTISHLFAGRFESFVVNSVISVISAYHIWTIRSKQHYDSRITLFLLVPVSIISLVLALRNQGAVGAFSCYAAMLSFYFVLPERQAWLAGGAVFLMCIPAYFYIGPTYTLAFGANLFLVGMFSSIFVNVIYKQQVKLQLQAVTDNLTGLLNRTILYDSLEQAIEQSRRKGIAMSIITFDIDHFKAINDSYGHDVGDDVLRKLGGLLKQRVRRADKAFRLGGEEFLILLFDADLEQARAVAEEFRDLIESTQFVSNHPVTVSLGVATLNQNENLNDWVKRSDEYLYAAKARGRNKVIARNFEPTPEMPSTVTNSLLN